MKQILTMALITTLSMFLGWTTVACNPTSDVTSSREDAGTDDGGKEPSDDSSSDTLVDETAIDSAGETDVADDGGGGAELDDAIDAGESESETVESGPGENDNTVEQDSQESPFGPVLFLRLSATGMPAGARQIVKVSGVTSSGEIDFTGHLQLLWRAIPPELLSVDSVGRLVAHAPGAVYLTAEARRPDGSVVSGSIIIDIDDRPLHHLYLTSYPLGYSSGPVVLLPTWALELFVSAIWCNQDCEDLYFQVLTAADLQVTPSSQGIIDMPIGETISIVALNPGETTLGLRFRDQANPPHEMSTTLPIKVWDNSLAQVELKLWDTNEIALALGMRLIAQGTISMIRNDASEWAFPSVAASYGDWQYSNPPFAEPECNISTCTFVGQSAAEGQISYWVDLGTDAFSATAQVLVYDPTEIDHLELSPNPVEVPADEEYYCPNMVLIVYKTNGEQTTLELENADPTGWTLQFCQSPAVGFQCSWLHCIDRHDPNAVYAVAEYRTHTAYAPVVFSK